MRKISVLLAVFVMLFAEAVLADAIVTSLTGKAQAARGTGAARSLRLGDEVVQGDTVFTGANSSVVLKFADGQVAALTSNSRMTVTAYQYNPQARTGNVLLSLIDGGMRAITGLIGRNAPDRVNYRAATATIGIRGTDVTLVTSAGDVVVSVTAGEVAVAFAGGTIVVKEGEAVYLHKDGSFQQDAAERILQLLPAGIADAIGGLEGLTNAINEAAQGGISGGSITPAPAGGGSASPS